MPEPEQGHTPSTHPEAVAEVPPAQVLPGTTHPPETLFSLLISGFSLQHAQSEERGLCQPSRSGVPVGHGGRARTRDDADAAGDAWPSCGVCTEARAPSAWVFRRRFQRNQHKEQPGANHLPWFERGCSMNFKAGAELMFGRFGTGSRSRPCCRCRYPKEPGAAARARLHNRAKLTLRFGGSGSTLDLA